MSEAMSLAKEMAKQISKVIRDKTRKLSDVAKEGLPDIPPVVGGHNRASAPGAEEDGDDIGKDYEASVWAQVQVAALILKSGGDAVATAREKRGGTAPVAQPKRTRKGGGSKGARKRGGSSRTVSAEWYSELRRLSRAYAVVSGSGHANTVVNVRTT